MQGLKLMDLLLVDNNFIPCATELIRSAKKSISISTFKAEMTTKPRGTKLYDFFLFLIKRHTEKIKIRFLINWNTEKKACPKTNLYVIKALRSKGIEIKTLPLNRCCHAKVISIDSEAAIIGSHNLSIRSCFNNFEISLFTENPANILKIDHAFNEVWQTAKP